MLTWFKFRKPGMTQATTGLAKRYCKATLARSVTSPPNRFFSFSILGLNFQ